MDYKDENKYHEHCSMLMGAIFMSNRKTKQECLKRKVFGLPLSKESFISKIKAGMLLFLFENVERKLYGVFEATSDGALNIVPNAYISYGTSFPAQVLFKRIWMCKPLTEDEFGDAIKENYYTPNRFNFGLSYEQVCKLLYLFSSKKIKVNLPPGRGIPNNLITKFEMYGGDESQVNGEDSFLDFNSTEYHKDRGEYLGRYSGPSRLNTNYPSYEKDFTSSQASLPNNGRGSYQMPPLVIKPTSPFVMHPTFPDYPSDGGNLPSYASHDVSHQYFGSFADKMPSVSLGIKDNPPLSREPNTRTPTMENRLPHFRSQIHPRQMSPNANYYSTNFHCSSLPISKISSVSLPPVEFEGYPNLQDRKYLTLPEQYDPSNPRISCSTLGNRTTEGMDSLLSRSNPNSEVVSGAQPLFDSSAQQIWGLGPSAEYIPLPGDNIGDFDRQPYHLDSPCDGYYSELEGDDSYELQHYSPSLTDEYPTDTKSRLHSDTEKSRTSVFSRLSKVSESRQKHTSCERDSRQKHTSCEHDSRDSLDQLVKLFSRRRDQILKANHHSTISNNQEQPGSKTMTDSNMSALLGNQLGFGSDTIDDESREVSFLNFKRRSKIRRFVGEDETGLYVMCDENKELAGNNKRRKLVRPSLNEESHNLDGTSRDNLDLGKQNNESESNTQNNESESNTKMNENKTSPSPGQSTSPKMDNVESAEINAGEGFLGPNKKNKEGESNNTTSETKSYASPGQSTSPKMVNVESAEINAGEGFLGPDKKNKEGESNNMTSEIKSYASPKTENIETVKMKAEEPAGREAKDGVTGKDVKANNQSLKPSPSSETKNAADSPRNQVKEISNTTLRWFLEKRT